METTTLSQAILNLRPEAKFHFREASFEGIDWEEELSVPLTKTELMAEVARIEESK